MLSFYRIAMFGDSLDRVLALQDILKTSTWLGEDCQQLNFTTFYFWVSAVKEADYHVGH